ncbi:unnamed protein product, partial [Mesorhabditis spiculigera]
MEWTASGREGDVPRLISAFDPVVMAEWQRIADNDPAGAQCGAILPSPHPAMMAQETDPNTMAPETDPNTMAPETDPNTMAPETDPNTKAPETDPSTLAPPDRNTPQASSAASPGSGVVQLICILMAIWATV